ncbi:O-antigen ligase family protein [Alicyclobacillus fodiniaquatilis]|jgi:O-antigen ligase|uniref:O-antigen ligase family protein n=1 Tax=Alicyclobacillus fodiniaquatilis TaxID=1661150 RepID=A0ABW4JEC6_9BACL
MQDQVHLSVGGKAETRSFASGLAKWCIYLLLAFPIVDYTLRTFVHPIGSIWDKLMLLLLSLIALTRYIRGQREIPFGWAKFAGWFILYCFGLLMVGLGHPSVAFDGFRFDVYYILFGLLMPFIMNREDVPKFFHLAASVAILVAVDGIFQYIMKAPIPGSWVDVTESVRTRVFSVFLSPNELGAYMELMTPIIFGLFMVEKVRIRRWIYGIGSLCCFLTLLFTFTRGAWMGFFVGVVFVAVLYQRRLLILIAVVAVIGFFLPPIHHRIMDVFSPVYMLKAAQGGRLLRWMDAFDQMSTNPLFGAGLGRYGGSVASLHGYSIYSDNYYAKMLGETGLLGLVLFLMLHISIIRELMKKVVRHAQGKEKFLALGGLAGLTAFLVDNCVENVFEYAPNIIAYFLMVSLFLIWGRSLQSREGQLDE